MEFGDLVKSFLNWILLQGVSWLVGWFGWLVCFGLVWFGWLVCFGLVGWLVVFFGWFGWFGWFVGLLVCWLFGGFVGWFGWLVGWLGRYFVQVCVNKCVATAVSCRHRNVVSPHYTVQPMSHYSPTNPQ
jgi:hypothetical protein